MNDSGTKPPAPADPFAVLRPWLGEAAAPPGATPVTLPGLCSGVSFQEGLRRCLGRVDLYDRIVKRFLQSRADEAGKLQAAFDEGDLETVRRLSHDIASTAGTLGAGGLSATALALQSAVNADADAQALAPLVHLFASEHAAVLDALASYARGNVDMQAPAQRKS